jgi:hypothetical protein
VDVDIFLESQDRIGLPLVPAKERIARLAKKRANMPFRVTVIHEQTRCGLRTNSAAAPLRKAHAFDIALGQAVFGSEVSAFIVFIGGIRILPAPFSEPKISRFPVSRSVLDAVRAPAFDAMRIPGPAASGNRVPSIEQGYGFDRVAMRASLVGEREVLSLMKPFPLLTVEYFH